MSLTAVPRSSGDDGLTFYANNNTAAFTVVSPIECASLISLNLTINHSTASTDIQTACNTYTWINGVTYAASNNTVKHILNNSAGCDSRITLD